MHRTKQHQTTIYELIRNPKLYDQQGYMKAADVANFAQPADLPRLVEWLGSSDQGYAYWDAIECIQLGKQAATPEVLTIIEKLIRTDVKDERTLDVRVTAALYLCRIEHQEDQALRSLAEVITTASNESAAKGRAWANLFLLGSEAKGIEGMLNGIKLDKKDQQTTILQTEKQQVESKEQEQEQTWANCQETQAGQQEEALRSATGWPSSLADSAVACWTTYAVGMEVRPELHKRMQSKLHPSNFELPDTQAAAATVSVQVRWWAVRT